MPNLERIIPVLTYQDIAAAHDFLIQAFGFSGGGVHRNAAGEAIHGEVRAGDHIVWLHRVMAEHRLESPQASDVANSGLFVYVDDVDAHYQQAQMAGARIDSPPVDQPYGQREYGARDLEGTDGGSPLRRQFDGRTDVCASSTCAGLRCVWTAPSKVVPLVGRRERSR